MKLFILLFTVLYSSAANTSEYNDESRLRTFFTSPQLRADLDELRKSGKFNLTHNASASVIFKEPLKVEMQGIMIHGNKQPIVFINDTSTLKSQSIDDSIRVNSNRIKHQTYKVPVSVNNKSIKLRPGQQWSESNNLVQDKYQIKPSKDKPDGVNTLLKSAIIE